MLRGRATTRDNAVQIRETLVDDGPGRATTRAHPTHPRRPRPYYTPIPVAPCFGGAEVHRSLFERYCPQGPHRATTFRETTPTRQRSAGQEERDRGAVRCVVARGRVGSGWALAGARPHHALAVFPTLPQPCRRVLLSMGEIGARSEYERLIL